MIRYVAIVEGATERAYLQQLNAFLLQEMVPAGMQPQQLRPYLERIVALEGEERTDEFCIVVAQIMEVACNVMFPKKDLEAVSSCYGCLLRWVKQEIVRFQRWSLLTENTGWKRQK